MNRTITAIQANSPGQRPQNQNQGYSQNPLFITHNPASGPGTTLLCIKMTSVNNVLAVALPKSR